MINLFQIIFSNQCNLRCKYCYVEKKGPAITLDKIPKIVDFIFKLKDKTPNFHITIFGGEPLLYQQELKEFIKLINNRYHIQIFTNGLLLNSDFLDFVKNYRVDFNISIDGCKKAHDINRIWPDGKGTYDDLIKIFPLYKDYYSIENKQFIGTGVITPNNYIYLLESLQTFPGLIHFSFDRSTDWSKISFNNYKKVIYNAADWYINNFKDLPYINLFFDPIISYSRNCFCNHFCRCGETEITLGPDLNLYPCAYFINSQYKIGDIFNGISQKNFDDFLKIKININNQCNNCSFFPFKNCQGQCYGNLLLNKNQSLPNGFCQIQLNNKEMNFYVKEKLQNDPRYIEMLVSRGGKL